MTDDRSTFERRFTTVAPGDRYIEGLITELLELRDKTDPQLGEQSAQGKDLAAAYALGFASMLVEILAGWALDGVTGPRRG
jgi:hypothetical protein